MSKIKEHHDETCNGCGHCDQLEPVRVSSTVQPMQPRSPRELQIMNYWYTKGFRSGFDLADKSPEPESKGCPYCLGKGQVIVDNSAIDCGVCDTTGICG